MQENPTPKIMASWVSPYTEVSSAKFGNCKLGKEHSQTLKIKFKSFKGKALNYSNVKSKGRVSCSFDSTQKIQDGADFDAIVIGSGVGGIVAATQLAVRGIKVALLEKYIIPGGSSGYFERNGYTFDVGSSVMFGCGKDVNFLVITRSKSTPKSS